MQVKKQQSELDMGQQTGSKSGKEYIKAVYCHPAYLTSFFVVVVFYFFKFYFIFKLFIIVLVLPNSF